MIDARLRSTTDLEAKIQQAIQDLENHCRNLPTAQQGAVKRIIERLDIALERDEVLMGDKGQCPRKRVSCC
jgi:predicted component of type VI protein secretion system